MTGVDLAQLSAHLADDPYGWYRELREQGPVVWLPDAGVHVATTHDAVTTITRDPGTFSSAQGLSALVGASGRADDSQGLQGVGLDLTQLRVLIASDPPEHTRLRRLLSRAFTPRAISALEPKLRASCAELVRDLINAGDAGDLVAQVASPFPVTVIAELLGIPPTDRGDFRRWSDALVGLVTSGTPGPDALPAVGEMFTYLSDVVDHRRANPTEDLLGRLVTLSTADAADQPLDQMEIVMFGILLLVAGNETTTNLIGNGYQALLDHPDAAARLRREPDLVPGTVEEALRYDTPAQGILRGATRDAEVAGTNLPEGSTVLVSFGAANRDPAHFDDPDRFDLERNPTDHFGFGHGIHYCLGASLARLEARIVAETLLDATSSVDPTAPPTRSQPSAVIRGFSRIPVHARRT